MTGHTPGPWKIAYRANNQSSYSVQAAGGMRVCAVRYNWRVSSSLDEANANARLIAAAPDLLAALKDFVADYKNAYGDDPEMEELTVVRQARDAIAKAEGKTDD